VPDPLFARPPARGRLARPAGRRPRLLGRARRLLLPLVAAAVAVASLPATAQQSPNQNAQQSQPQAPQQRQLMGSGSTGQGPTINRPPESGGGLGPSQSDRPTGTEPLGNAKALEPYGSQLFTNTTALDRVLSVNPDYEIQPGDRVAVQIWGARTFNDVLNVDQQGNIFLPEIGPIALTGVRNANLSQVVRNRVQQVYKRNVNVYTNLLGTQPIGVYVTGAVEAPGRYAGNRTDSLIYYLTRAKGIDQQRGSYRRIHIKRGGERIATADLYAFLRRGDLPSIDFRNNDTIVVETRAKTVSVSGEITNAYLFEIEPGETRGGDIIDLAQPAPTASHVMVRGIRNDRSFSTYVPLADFRDLRVRDGDDIEFFADRVPQEIVVSVQGNSGGPSSFTLPRGTTLGTFAKLVQVDPQVARLDAIYLRRDSVAERQKQAIERALRELERNALTTPSTTTSEAEVRAQEAELVQEFVERAREVEPEGRVALNDARDWRDVRLKEGDEVVIPEVTDVVLISGEVKVPQTVIFNDSYSVQDYIEQAGGVSERGGLDNIVVIRADGSVHTGNEPIRNGDHIMVLPEVQSKAFAITKDIVEIIFRSAVSAGTVINAFN
jgi:protein involved in polysaccharide export with SLBB domain